MQALQHLGRGLVPCHHRHCNKFAPAAPQLKTAQCQHPSPSFGPAPLAHHHSLRLLGKHRTSRTVELKAVGRQGVSKAGKELWGGSKHVRAVSAEEAESMYMALCERTNEQHVLLIIYTPGCQQCKQMESEVEHLATGLSHVNSLSVCALNIDNDDVARYFAKEILGLKFVPSVVLFPKHSRTYYKFKGKAHSSEHLLRFLNMVCNQHDDKIWTLSNATSSARSVGAGQGSGVGSFVSSQSNLVLGVFAGLAVAVVAAGFAVRQRAVELQQQPGVTVAAADGHDGGYQDLVRNIDASITRMAVLMLKLVGARIGLGVEHMRTSVPNYQLILGGGQQHSPATAIDLPPSSPSTSPATPAASPQAQAPPILATVPAPSQPTTSLSGSSTSNDSSRPINGEPASTSPWSAPRQTPSAGDSQVKTGTRTTHGAAQAPDSTNGLVAAAAAARAAVAARAKATSEQQSQQGGAPARSGKDALVDALRGQLPGQEDEAKLTGEAVKMARKLSADEVLRLLEEEGRDVSKVLERLSSQSQNQDYKLFRVEKR